MDARMTLHRRAERFAALGVGLLAAILLPACAPNLGGDQPPIDAGTGSPSDTGCVSGQRECGGQCVDVSSDPANCGACGTVCGSGMSCESGVCACPAGYEACGGRCVNTQSDSQNCGACGTRCGSGTFCSAGACKSSGGSGGGGADGGIGGGPGGVTCSGGQTNCGGFFGCTDLSIDPFNCGACGNVCPSFSCTKGTCDPGGGTGGAADGGTGTTCPAGQTDCGGFTGCTDLTSDPSNCGACGNACPSGTCTGGVCG